MTTKPYSFAQQMQTVAELMLAVAGESVSVIKRAAPEQALKLKHQDEWTIYHTGTVTVSFNFTAGRPALNTPYTLINSGALGPAFNPDSFVATSYIPATFSAFGNDIQVTFNARTEYGLTVTLPNHVTMVTGRPVLQPLGQPNTVHHGWTSNSDPQPTLVLHGTNPNLPYVAYVFDIAHDAGLSTALYAGKTRFVLLDRSYDAAHGALDASLPDNGTDKIDRYVYGAPGTPPTGTAVHTVSCPR